MQGGGTAACMSSFRVGSFILREVSVRTWRSRPWSVHVVILTSSADMLMSLASAPSRLSTPPDIGHNEVGWRTCQVMVPSLQLLQVLIIDQPLLPEVLEEVEVRPTCAQGLSKDTMVEAHMLHTLAPGRPPVVTCVLELVTQRTLNRLGRLLAPKMTQAVCGPFVLVVGYIRAFEEPEAALEGRLSDLGHSLFEHAIVLLEQGHAREVTRQTGANGRLGGRGIGVGVVVERGGVCRRVGGLLVYTRWRHGHGHGRGGAMGGAGVRGTGRVRGVWLRVGRRREVHQASVDVSGG
jgi:hypothetical protein